MRQPQLSPYKLLAWPEGDLFLRMEADTGPMHVRIDPTEACNHKCPRCFYGEAQRDEGVERSLARKGGRHLVFDDLAAALGDMWDRGLLAVTLTGGGEPTLHPEFGRILEACQHLGLSYAVTTNGAKSFSPEELARLSEAALVRFSIDAGTEETYTRLHRPGGQSSLVRTIDNLAALAEVGGGAAIGASFLVQPENAGEVIAFACMVKAAGGSFVVYRPIYSQETKAEMTALLPQLVEDLEAARQRLGEDFTVIPLLDEFAASQSACDLRAYERCRYHHLVTQIGADGNVYPCCMLSYNPEHVWGNIARQSFSEIWEGAVRARDIERLGADFCPRCPYDRQNEVLEYLMADEKPHTEFV